VGLLSGAQRGTRLTVTSADRREKEFLAMNIALLIIIVIAIVIAIVSGLNASLQWLLWVALIVGVIALIAFLFRVISGRKNV
jgi:uncharacterized protein (DUF983 family)